MQFKTIKPGRRTFLSLAVMLTLAPMGAGVHHLLNANETRTAATIADLEESYHGGIWSNRDLETQNTAADLVITSRVRTRFAGTFTVGDGDAQIIPVTGGVSASGRVALNGTLSQGNNRIRVNITGQLSAGGDAIIGSYTATGRTEEGPLNDRGSVALLDNTAPKS